MNEKTTFTPQKLVQVLDSHFSVSKNGTLYVAYSGGPDSTALLHALSHTEKFHVVAAHAHHGHAQAEVWLRHCASQCERWDVEFVFKKLTVDKDPARGWEASARKARYAWFESLLDANDVIATAHHQQDQAETVLARLLRGSGVTGLSGIPKQRALGKGSVVRPLLEFDPAALRSYLSAQGVDWVEDPSNADERYTRNLIRLQVLPLLRRYWPAVNTTLAGTAKRLREVDGLLLEFGEADLLQARYQEDALSVSALRTLSPGRQINVLRTWLREQGARMPPYKRIQQAMSQLIAADPPPTAIVAWDAHSLRRYRDGLYLVTGPADASRQQYAWDLRKPLLLEPLPLALYANPAVKGRGLAEERLTQPLSVRWRRGGEVCRLPGRQHHSRLKKLLQDAGVPPWQRDQIPLLFCGEQLAAVVGYWYCEPYAAQAAEKGTELVLKPLTG